MSKNGHNIDDQFREGLQNYEVEPPIRVWQNMIDDLPQPAPFYQTAQFLYTLLTTVVLVSGVVLYYMVPNNGESLKEVQTAPFIEKPTSIATESTLSNDCDNATKSVEPLSPDRRDLSTPKPSPVVLPRNFAFEATDRGKPSKEPKQRAIQPSTTRKSSHSKRPKVHSSLPSANKTKAVITHTAPPTPQKKKEKDIVVVKPAVYQIQPNKAVVSKPVAKTTVVPTAPKQTVQETPIVKEEKTKKVIEDVVKQEAKEGNNVKANPVRLTENANPPEQKPVETLPIDTVGEPVEMKISPPTAPVVKQQNSKPTEVAPLSKEKEIDSEPKESIVVQPATVPKVVKETTPAIAAPTKETTPKPATPKAAPVIIGDEAETPLRLAMDTPFPSFEEEKKPEPTVAVEEEIKQEAKTSAVEAEETAATFIPPLPSIKRSSVLSAVDDEMGLKKPSQQIDLLKRGAKLAKTTGLSFGVFGTINNTSLWSSRASEANVNGTLNPNLDFGTSYGLALSYDFTPNYGIQLEWIIDSKQGQKYYNFRPQPNARMRHNYTDINLRYTHFPVLFKYKFNRYSDLTKQPSVINYLIGFQYGWLKSAEINMDNPVIQNDLLQKNSFGLVLGMDYDLYLTKNYLFSVGARSSLSTNSNSLVSLPFGQKTKNLLFGIKAGLTYRFGK